MSLELVTGYSAEPHVSSADDGALNACVFGTGRAVLDLGQKFAASITSNNEITILDGDAIDQGRHIRMTPGDYETVTISNGAAGLYRSDLICIQYDKNPETDVETASFVVMEGTPGSSYVDPDLTDGDILSGDTLDQFPLYRVKINGFSLDSIEPLFDVCTTIRDAVDAAQDTADRAESKADAAQSSADVAQAAADAAQTAADAAQTAADVAQADATAALAKLVKVRVQGTTDMYGKISLPDSTIYPLAALSNTFAITGEYNLRVVNVSTDSAILAKNTAVDFWIIGMKK